MIENTKFIHQKQFLADDEFETLKKIIHLLKESEIRYIVNKYELSFQANMIESVNDLVSFFSFLRTNDALKDIFDEIKALIANKDKMQIRRLSISPFDPNFFSQPNPLLHQSGFPFILGPISVFPGKSEGSFDFYYDISYESSPKFININFLYLGGVPHQFEIECNINGVPVNISIDDPNPQPIDITDLILTGPDANNLVIEKIQTPKPMMICICEYDYYGIQMLLDQITGKKTNIITDDFYVFSKHCNHEGTFSLVDFLSNSLATGSFKCSICNREINPFDLEIICPRVIE